MNLNCSFGHKHGLRHDNHEHYISEEFLKIVDSLYFNSLHIMILVLLYMLGYAYKHNGTSMLDYAL